MVANKLYYGDNLEILERYVESESVDLIYLDPPFNSNVDYNILFSEKNGTDAASQIQAFTDTWHWDYHAQESFQRAVEQGGPVSETLQALHKILGANDMMAYISMMAPRLVELRRVLKNTGSLYLHCDPTASHYLKILLDGVFGPASFRNEIIWKRTSGHYSSKRWGPIHDVILFYTKTDQFTWNTVYQPYDEQYLNSYYKHEDKGGRFRIGDLTGAGVRTGKSGKPWRGCNPTNKNRHWAVPTKILEELNVHTSGKDINKLTPQEKLDVLDELGLIHWPPKGLVPQYKRYLDENKGVPVQDVIIDIQPLGPFAAERLGYPTQKPSALLERIILSSSNEGDVVLDPFCGCGTAIEVAHSLRRKWTGIDITYLAIALIKNRLQGAFGVAVEYEVVGEPISLPDAHELAVADPYQFQWWALGLVSARPTEQKKGADQGIDGKIFFHDDDSGRTKTIILSVKAGKVNVSHVRDLVGVLDREKAQIGVLISFQKPTRPMVTEAASAGLYRSPGWGKDYPRIQILTIDQLLGGGSIQSPPPQAPYKKAPPANCHGYTEDKMF